MQIFGGLLFKRFIFGIWKEGKSSQLHQFDLIYGIVTRVSQVVEDPVNLDNIMDPDVWISIRISHVRILKHIYTDLLQLFNQSIDFHLLLFVTLSLFFHLKTVNRQIVILLLRTFLTRVGILFASMHPIVFGESFLLNTPMTSIRKRKVVATLLEGTRCILLASLRLCSHF